MKHNIASFSRKFDDTDCFVTGRHRGDRLLSLRGWQKEWELYFHNFFLFALNPERGRASKRKGTYYLIMSITTRIPWEKREIEGEIYKLQDVHTEREMEYDCN